MPLFSVRLLLLVIAYYVLLANGQQVGVSLVLQGQIIPNNSLVDFEDLAYQAPVDGYRDAPTNANGRQTLICVTDLVACCETEGLGNWYDPDGNQVITSDTGAATFRANRGQNEEINGQQFYGSVRIWRRYTPPERGLFHCELPDAGGGTQVRHVNILFFARIADGSPLSVAISSSGSTIAGETYSLTCSASLHSRNPPIPDPNIPSPTFEWFFGPNGNAPLPSGLTPTPTVLSSDTYNSTLEFSPLSQFHIGNYRCRLGAGGLVNSAMVTVNAPTISVQISPKGAPVLGQNGYFLMCNVSGAEKLSPSITYQWTKNNGTQTQIQLGTDEVFCFSPLRLSDAGRYTCQVTVSSPYINNNITIMNSRDVTIQILAPTSVMLSSNPATCTPIPPFGSDITLTCTVLLTSGPEIDVPLNVNFELLRTIPAGSPLTTTTPSVSGSTYITTAMISSFERNDSGVYTCRATISSASTYISDSNTESDSLRVATGVHLTLRGVSVANNSNISIRTC